MATKKEVATVPKTEIVRQEIPAFMQGMAGAGTEAMTAADVEIPRIKLLQALDEQVQNEDEKPGYFWHTIAEVNLGQELRIIPVFTAQGFILWRPRQMGGGILARADDAINWNPASAEFHVQLDHSKKQVTWRTAKTVRESGLDNWGSSDPSDPNSQPAATRMYNIAVVLPDFPEYSPAVVTLQRSAVKVARKFIGKLMLSQAPSFGLIFKMFGVKDQNSVGQEFYNYRFQGDGLVENEELFNYAKSVYEQFKKTGLRVKDEEKLQEDVIPGEPTATAEPAY